MSDIAIRFDNLSKLYHINARQKRHDTLRNALVARFRCADQFTTSQSINSDDTGLWGSRSVSLRHALSAAERPPYLSWEH